VDDTRKFGGQGVPSISAIVHPIYFIRAILLQINTGEFARNPLATLAQALRQ
jgi:hypothetical protein